VDIHVVKGNNRYHVFIFVVFLDCCGAVVTDVGHPMILYPLTKKYMLFPAFIKMMRAIKHKWWLILCLYDYELNHAIFL
jgi:hypothetical protein